MLGFVPPADIVFPVRTEPRSYFANERTLLMWYELSMTLAVLGAALQTSSNSFTIQSVGIALSIPALAFVVYALRMYFLRFSSLEYKRPQHFEDKTGTLVLCLLVTGMVVGNSALVAAKKSSVREWHSGSG
ncbi:hypothetical protein EMIHUDRAFT_216239 [Emiliania huxleyi CCMP1516]|uniref:DUF202 domain-containing protein n=2 Tax=Emiliania huxleyi TaxID=2903 RepID=A0A0D3IFN0_EMIH1|nr:hypothetical protein EMIHUDRAFT_216239 [Emiliania huxleyi CCMP1516]EOD10065.1 hypothetical protein EMIHUDRAFT_216239 [Emiliania huxleyi CCMP1516]|eukprot:XP_005762494.1 hypothetical protein EMIHUDRAFT_216239 [Emiliania huxleyi CCMP1516]